MKSKTLRCRFKSGSLTRIGIEVDLGHMTLEDAHALLADSVLECKLKLDGSDVEGQLDLDGELVKDGYDIVGDSKNVVLNKLTMKFGVAFDADLTEIDTIKKFVGKAGTVTIKKVGAASAKKDAEDDDE